MPANADTAGCSTAGTQYVASLAFVGTSAISVTYAEHWREACRLHADPDGDCRQLPDIPTWTGSHGACDNKYVPSNFRLKAFRLQIRAGGAFAPRPFLLGLARRSGAS